MPGAWSTMVVQVHAGPLTALLKVLLVLALLIPPSVGPAWSPRRRVPLPMLFCVVEPGSLAPGCLGTRTCECLSRGMVHVLLYVGGHSGGVGPQWSDDNNNNNKSFERGRDEHTKNTTVLTTLDTVPSFLRFVGSSFRDDRYGDRYDCRTDALGETGAISQREF